jgi:hypothetical protein
MAGFSALSGFNVHAKIARDLANRFKLLFGIRRSKAFSLSLFFFFSQCGMKVISRDREQRWGLLKVVGRENS